MAEFGASDRTDCSVVLNYERRKNCAWWNPEEN